MVLSSKRGSLLAMGLLQAYIINAPGGSLFHVEPEFEVRILHDIAPAGL